MLNLILKRFQHFQRCRTLFQSKSIFKYSQNNNIKKVKIQSLEQLTKKQIGNTFKIECEKNTHYMFTNSYLQTLESSKTVIQRIKNTQNCKFISNFQSSLQKTNCFKSNIQQQKLDKFRQLQLIVGDYNQQFFELIDTSRILTLEEIGTLFPEKLPLSYRSRDVKQQRSILQKRLNKNNKLNPVNLEHQPIFSKVIFCNQNVQMWDQAIQVILDCLPAPIIFPYHKNKQSQKFYTLTQKDFIQALKTCHDIIHKQDYPMQINEFTIIEHLRYMLSNINKENTFLRSDQKVFVQIERQLIQQEEVSDKDITAKLDSIFREFEKYQIRFI